MSKDITFTSNSQTRSNGGKTRAARLSPAQRSEIARHASLSRKCIKTKINATHTGEIKIGSEISIACAVLEDGKRVITQGGMNNALGRKGKNASTIHSGTALILPNFINAENLQEFIDEDLKKILSPIVFKHKNSSLSYGFEAVILPEICKIYLKARSEGKLLSSQMKIADNCQILLIALAKVGIISLVDESTGFQRDRENDELQKLFSRFLYKELQPWVKKFPDHFFANLKKMYGLDQLKKTPSFAGHFINKFIYDELSPEIRQELERLNPKQENGYRKGRHHQLLTEDFGCPALEKQIVKVTTLMSISESKDEFEQYFNRSKNSDNLPKTN